ncbi:uncharacterized protein LOC117300139 [Asterias rubens]|uniref:uncharacterized protein LOC117300139 n=1 Tax=Asterias rubens TaxID=7604 RepID=UPI0014553F3F|nr:uncharacterized protein LOC117300139 [Asterias rubens]XP_033639746.1 uncharacterized protein LOC117300139 [Asterias rubens]XP_033639747.1 uncharacterized protein LOC117300139 [Asterias rubens]
MATSTNADLETDGFSPDGETTDHAASLDVLKSQQSLLLQEIDDDLGDGFDGDGFDDDAGGTPKVFMPGLQPFDRGRGGLPSNWSNGTVSGDSPLCLMPLTKQSWEFQAILSEFKDAELTVKTIERIENRKLWEKFELEEKWMKKNTEVMNEVYLFHGTTAPQEQICREGLDQRLSRIGYFGRGIYFSNDPRKCVSYTQSEEGSKSFQLSTCTIYKCRVLLGNMKVYPPGQSDKFLKREPLLEPGGHKYHDSVKGHVKQYDEFVIYKSERVMPEYVISCFTPTAPSTNKASAVGQTVSTSANPDSYSGLDEDEVSAELRAASAKKTQKNGASKEDCAVNCLSGDLDEDEISAELKAGALPTSQLEDEETHPELEQEGGLVELDESNRHWEVEAEEQWHSLEVVPPEVSIPKEKKNRSRNQPVETSETDLDVVENHLEDSGEEEERSNSSSNRNVEDTETDLGVVENCLNDSGDEASKSGIRTASATHSSPDARPLDQDDNAAWGSTSNEQHQRQLEAVRTRMKANQPLKSAGESRQEPAAVTPKTETESGRYARKELIDPEFLPVILEVRERVQRARLLENQNKDSSSASASSRAPVRSNREPDPTAWSPSELAKHKKLLETIRVKVQADRRQEAQDKKKKQRVAGNDDQQDIIDNSASSSWMVDDDGVQELLDTLIVQFMEFTACEEIEEAREYVMKASMDVNKAIVNYLNG